MECQLKDRDRLINSYLLDELSEEEQIKFESHFIQCKVCFQELRLTEDAINLMKKEKHAIFELIDSKWAKIERFLINKFSWKFRVEKIQWNYARVAIATFSVLVIVGILLLAYHLYIDYKIREDFADNFKKSSLFENLINQTARSDMSVSNVQPQNNTNFKNNILFQWKPRVDKKNMGSFTLIIYNNKEQKLHEYIVEGTIFHFKVKLSPGLYYWVLLNEDENLYIGKFYIKKPFF